MHRFSFQNKMCEEQIFKFAVTEKNRPIEFHAYLLMITIFRYFKKRN